jgi:hypothetical protein
VFYIGNKRARRFSSVKKQRAALHYHELIIRLSRRNISIVAAAARAPRKAADKKAGPQKVGCRGRVGDDPLSHPILLLQSASYTEDHSL